MQILIKELFHIISKLQENSSNFVVQPLVLNRVVSFKVVKDNIKKNYDNIEFNINTLVYSFDI
ncbi:455_t:CDS:2 [Cetraspora pellucida]|uniref:455_t:CDS:1 n=1 Tax=Cetraspora pellucida TaxID=1433469 RepID=A0A9N9HHF4_9GLOM|nr:455_t:CDS:2 [Cetraspora pellucida]